MSNQAKKDHLDNLRHSCAHLLAAAVLKLYPGAHNAIGPAIENGFYQDFDLGDIKISAADLPNIEQQMRELLPTWVRFEFKDVSLEEARKLFKHNPYKLELAEEFAKEGKKLMTNNPGNFLDLCKMSHVDNPSETLQYFKLLSVAGAYWRGNEKKKMLTRIYGTAFPSQEELDTYVHQLEEAEKRDHKKLAAELDLIVFSELVGSGLPLYTPKGAILRNQVYNFSRTLNAKIGYQETALPSVNRGELFKVSGHYEKYKQDMFLVKSSYSSEEFFLKPMNCPQHCVLFGSRMRSYRDLPIRFSDFSVLYRDEKPGEINGLFRSRAFTQDDGHCFCREDQIGEEFRRVLQVVDEALKVYKFDYYIRLSLRDPNHKEKYLGDDEVWNRAESKLREIVEQSHISYKDSIGEAAIYGPKLDFMARDSLGRQWQISTIQLDMIMPARFGLTFTNQTGKPETPYMIHRAIIGSERFIAILIEHYAGAFPLWLSPVQVAILPISDKQQAYAQEAYAKLVDAGIRVELDDSNETLGKKIRNWELQKVPYIGVLGNKETETKSIAIRKRHQGNIGVVPLDTFVSQILKEVESRS